MAHIGQSAVPVLKIIYVKLKMKPAFSSAPHFHPVDESLFHLENNAHHEGPVIQLVNHLLHHAQQQGASDLHIEPYQQLFRIRYRQDGLLHEVAELQTYLGLRIITRLKVMADLDIAERRLPQDGHFQINIPDQRTIDIRISTCPTLQGEKIVLRLLDNAKLSLGLHSLGFTFKQKDLFLEKISQPQGLILVTGPTGSGKTVTLYSALDHLNTKEKNILTIEDPVEIQLDGINQVNLNPKAGLDFATLLRAFLRQDPDIIMVGEIRDLETAKTAIQAAQTGHLVLSTIHSNNAAETLIRLVSMGITTDQLASALSLIVAQRLVRKYCNFCKGALINNHGCKLCHQGYKGRAGIFECLAMSENLIQLLMKNRGTALLVKAAKNEGFATLWETGLEKVHRGETSLAELHRALLK